MGKLTLHSDTHIIIHILGKCKACFIIFQQKTEMRLPWEIPQNTKAFS